MEVVAKEGHRLSVISVARADDSLLLLFLRETHEFMVHSADLEDPNQLLVLSLEVNCCFVFFGELDRFLQVSPECDVGALLLLAVGSHDIRDLHIKNQK